MAIAEISHHNEIQAAARVPLEISSDARVAS